MAKLNVFVFFVVLGNLLGWQATAATVFRQGFDDINQFEVSDRSYLGSVNGHRVADDIQLVKDTVVNKISWYGRYLSTPVEDDFLIEVWGAAGTDMHLPGVVLDARVTRKQVTDFSNFHNVFGGDRKPDLSHNIFFYEAFLETPHLFGRRDYISIHNDTVAGNWSWASDYAFTGINNNQNNKFTPMGQEVRNRTDFEDDGVFELSPQSNVFNFTLALENVGTVSTVPVPAALPLMFTGIGAIGLLQWRKKRQENSA